MTWLAKCTMMMMMMMMTMMQALEAQQATHIQQQSNTSTADAW
jgi:hypothetical protein